MDGSLRIAATDVQDIAPDSCSYGAAALAVVKMSEHLTFVRGFMRQPTYLHCDFDRGPPAICILPMSAAMMPQQFDRDEQEDM